MSKSHLKPVSHAGFWEFSLPALAVHLRPPFRTEQGRLVPTTTPPLVLRHYLRAYAHSDYLPDEQRAEVAVVKVFNDVLGDDGFVGFEQVGVARACFGG